MWTPRRFVCRLALAGVLLALLPVWEMPARAADGPTLLKRTVMIKLRRFSRYWPNPAAKEPQYSTYSWVPGVSFEVIGPIPGGSQFVAEFQKADGSPWLSANMPTDEIGADDSAVIKMPDTDENALEKKAITAIGTFPFKIRLKNALAGKNEVFFSGKYEVTKVPMRVPGDAKNTHDFATVEDWRAPLGYLWLNPKSDENAPTLSVQMWFRGGTNDTQALLFKDGQQIADSRGNEEAELPTAASEAPYNWSLRQFNFLKVRGFNKEEANRYEAHFLDKNPGNYEIRVLRDGKLARVAKFTVGADGKIVDNGVASGNKMGGIRMVLPVQVMGTADKPLKADNWKTHALYGNPLSGFGGPGAASTAPSTTPASTTPATAAEPKADEPKTAVAAATDTPAADTPAAPGGPTLLKSTLAIRAHRMVRFWKQPNVDNYWSWVPTGVFYVLGPVTAGTKFVVDFTMPDGKPWMSVDCPCDAAAANEMRMVTIPGAQGHMDKRAITDVGTFGFKIRMVNEATGAKAQMMSGKFQVAKYHKGNALPQFKNQFEYYVDHDWLLPIGYFWVNWLREPNVPPLQVMMWFKNRSSDSTKVAAYVFYKGKQIASSKEQTASAGTTASILTSSSDDTDPAYQLWTFTFNQIRGWNTDTSGNRYDAHMLATNPGEYEIKVLWDGNLVRTAKFTVGDDGKIVDNGLVAKNKIGGVMMILPVHVQGSADGKWDAQAWKTEAFYGNPLQGFTAP